MIENAPVSRAAPTDAELLAASLEHPESFRTLFERHYRPVWRFLAWRFGGAAADGKP